MDKTIATNMIIPMIGNNQGIKGVNGY
jgi:hypothetical protein